MVCSGITLCSCANMAGSLTTLISAHFYPIHLIHFKMIQSVSGQTYTVNDFGSVHKFKQKKLFKFVFSLSHQ